MKIFTYLQILPQQGVIEVDMGGLGLFPLHFRQELLGGERHARHLPVGFGDFGHLCVWMFVVVCGGGLREKGGGIGWIDAHTHTHTHKHTHTHTHTKHKQSID